MSNTVTNPTDSNGRAITAGYDPTGQQLVMLQTAAAASADSKGNVYAPLIAQLAADATITVGTVVIEAVSGTALGADQTNSILKTSLYVKTTAAGDTVLALGRSTKANSLPVTMASDQDNINVAVNAALPAGTALIGGFNLIDSAGTNKAGVTAQNLLLVTDGGTATVQITASSAGAVKASPGRLCRVLVGTTATAAVNIYDNTNAASGTIIGAVPAGAAIGTVYAPEMPAAVGIYVGGAAGTPQLTVSFA